MKKLVSLLSIFISILLINITQTNLSYRSIRSFNTKMLKYSIVLLEGDLQYEAQLIEFAKKNNVDLMYNVHSEKEFEVAMVMFLSNSEALNQFTLSESMTAEEFNDINYQLRNVKSELHTYIEMVNSKVDYSLIPWSQSSTIPNSFYAYAATDEQINNFITDLSEIGITAVMNTTVFPNKWEVEVRSTLALLLRDQLFYGTLLLLTIVMLHFMYKSFRKDSILRIQGYSYLQLIFEKVKGILLPLVYALVPSSILFSFIFGMKTGNFINFSLIYLTQSILIALYIMLIIMLMQFLSVKSKVTDGIRNKRSISYFYAFILVKTVMIIFLIINASVSLERTFTLFDKKKELIQNKDLYEDVFTLTNATGQFDAEYWFNANEVLYETLNEKLPVYFAVSLGDITGGTELIIMNNNYANHLDLRSSKGGNIKLATNELVIITNESNVSNVERLSKDSIICMSIDIAQGCGNTNVIAVSNDAVIPITGNEAKYVEPPFVIITNQSPDLFIEYQFIQNDQEGIESQLEQAISNFPIEYINMGKLHEEYERMINNQFQQFLYELIVVGALMILLIFTIYNIHYDIYKKNYSTLYMNGNSTQSMLFPIFIFQFSLLIVSGFVGWYSVRSWQFVLISTHVLLMVETVCYILKSRLLNRNIIKNIKGG